MTAGRFRKLALVATVATLVQIGSGGLVRATGSGEGCPDWPRCFGRWLPPLRARALIEYTHRFIASIAILLVLAVAVAAVRSFRRDPRVLWPSLAAAGTIIVLAGIGAVVVKTGLDATMVTFHIAVAMALVGTLVYATVTAFSLDGAAPADSRTPVLATYALVATLALILLGAEVRGSGAALVFPDWPLMNGRVIPELGGLATRHFLHRAAALVTGMVILALVVAAWRARPRNRAAGVFATVAGGLFLVQAIVGAAQIWTTLAAPPVVLHVMLSSLVWAAVVAAFTATRATPAPDPAPAAARERVRPEIPAPISGAQLVALPEAPVAPPTVLSLGARLRAYYELTKPRIILLLLITTVPTMILAERGVPSFALILATLIGGALAAGSANAINCYADRDIDALMPRTRNRPLPLHVVEPSSALRFGIALGIVAFAWLTAAVNPLAATLAVGAILFYVFVYTLVLKRSTPQNIVIGGAAGAMPVLVGWAAVTGRLSAQAVALFLIIYYWTPPHFWALAMRYAGDYEMARVPMLPVIADRVQTTRQIMLYSVLLVAATLLFTPIAHMGLVYFWSALALGFEFLRRAARLLRERSNAAAMRLFTYSISYLTLLFAAVAIDALVPLG